MTFETVLIMSLGACADAVSLTLMRKAAGPVLQGQKGQRSYRISCRPHVQAIENAESLPRRMDCSTEGHSVSTIPERLGELAGPVMTSGTEQCDMLPLRKWQP